jgi:hypothetical protein
MYSCNISKITTQRHVPSFACRSCGTCKLRRRRLMAAWELQQRQQQQQVVLRLPHLD